MIWLEACILGGSVVLIAKGISVFMFVNNVFKIKKARIRHSDGRLRRVCQNHRCLLKTNQLAVLDSINCDFCRKESTHV